MSIRFNSFNFRSTPGFMSFLTLIGRLILFSNRTLGEVAFEPPGLVGWTSPILKLRLAIV